MTKFLVFEPFFRIQTRFFSDFAQTKKTLQMSAYPMSVLNKKKDRFVVNLVDNNRTSQCDHDYHENHPVLVAFDLDTNDKTKFIVTTSVGSDTVRGFLGAGNANTSSETETSVPYCLGQTFASV